MNYCSMQPWIHQILDLLEAHFGSSVEFVVHDLTLNYEHTIVDIRNGEITGRQIGDTGDILGLQVLRGTENNSDDNFYQNISFTTVSYTHLSNGTSILVHTIGYSSANLPRNRYWQA